MISPGTMWAIFFAYAAALGALTLVVIAKGAEPMRRTVWVLVAVCILGFCYQYFVSTNWTYSAFMVAVNAVACRVITRHPASRWQALIGWSFIIQIGTDIGRIAVELNGGVADQAVLYWETTSLAYLQLLLVIGWGADGLRRHGHRSRHNPISASSRPQGMV